MTGLPAAHRRAVHRLVDVLPADLPWALTGSTSFALQGLDLKPDDIDVQTTEAGAYRIEATFADAVATPVEFRESEGIRSHFGVLGLEGIEVEIMGDVERRGPDGWVGPPDLSAHRQMVTVDCRSVPVLDLAYEARAYEMLGREKRAAQLRAHVET